MVSISPPTGPVGRRRRLFGKLEPGVISDIVFRNLGAPNPAVKVGPRGGFDNAVVSIGAGKSLILTSDPVSMIPAIGMKKSAWLSLHHLVSDFTTTGLKPEFAVFDFNLPTELSTNQLKAYFEALGDYCKELGISIVAGHTGRYPGGGFTVVGGGVVFGVARDGGYLNPEMASRGDAIILTKGAAIETTAILANSFPETVERELGRRMLGRARSYLSLCSTVGDALEAVSGAFRGGVTSMHDATEGGVLGALHEHAVASGRSFLVEKRRIHVSEETRGVCSIFRTDPLLSLSGGALIITCKRESVEGLIGRLRRKGIKSFEIGRVGERGRIGLWLVSNEDRAKRFTPRGRDPYWDAYEKAVERGLK